MSNPWSFLCLLLRVSGVSFDKKTQWSQKAVPLTVRAGQQATNSVGVIENPTVEISRLISRCLTLIQPLHFATVVHKEIFYRLIE